jgi:UDP-galactopyranose mutase
VLLCLSHLRWDFVFQRPQHLLTRFTRDHEVIFLEEPMEHDGMVPRLELSERPAEGGSSVTVAVPLMPRGLARETVARAQRFLLEGLVERFNGRRMVAWFYTPMALAFADELEADVTVYDCMDELSAFRGAPPEMVELERQLLRRADLVFTGGRSLYEAKQGKHPRVHCFPSSIDTKHYHQARQHPPCPAELERMPRPRLGFFGVIDERMDAGLVGRMAELRPDWQFVMIGPVVKVDPADLPRRDNIHWLGGRQYAQLPGYLGHLDIGFMPFALNESTRFISPTKTPEFLAAGLPVVSTPVTDVVRDYGDPGYVEIARSAEEMVAATERLLAMPREAWLQRVDRKLAEGSWDRTQERMAALIREAQQRSGAGALSGAEIAAGPA